MSACLRCAFDPDATISASWSFFIDRGVKLDGRDVSGASSALGRFLKDYNGQVYVAADGKCWQLWIGRDRCGSLVSIVETTGA